MKWFLRFYPPFLFQRIWVKSIQEDFMRIDIKIYKSFLNINSNRTIFGGTIFSAADPVYPLLFSQLFKLHGLPKTITWLKSASIDYKKPGRSTLTLQVDIRKHQLEEALKKIRSDGKVVQSFTADIKDKTGEICATTKSEIYVRDLRFNSLDEKVNTT